MLLLTVGAASTMTGCSVLRGPQSKTELLNKSLKQFKNALFWNSFDQLAMFANPEDRAALVESIKKARSKERVVRIDVRNVDLAQDEAQADVDLLINYYEVPKYVVSTRKERYTWIYDGLRDTWFVKAFEVLPDDEEPVDVQGVLGTY